MCGVIFPDAAAIFMKGDVEYPVAAVLDSPMLPCVAELVRGVAVVAGDVVVIFDRGFFVAGLFAADADNLTKVGPLMTIHPWSMNRTGPGGAYVVSSTPILFVDGGTRGVFNLFPSALIGIGKEINDIIERSGLITFYLQ